MGIPLAGHFRAAGLPAEALEVTDLVILEKPIWTLLDRIRHREGVEDVGFQIGASHRVTDVIGLRVPLSGHCTLLETMRAFCNLLHCHANSWDYWIERAEGGVRLCRRPTPIDVGEWPMEQYAVSYLVDLVRLATADTWWPREIWLQNEPQLTKEESRWLRDARLHFGGPVTAILVPDFLLNAPVEIPPVANGVEPENDSLEVDLVSILRPVLRSYLPTKRMHLQEISDFIGLHPRTLQRRLRSLGTSYQKVLDEARFELARDRLEGDQPISEISTELGFGHLSAFSRTFRRWAGVPPSRYRQMRRTG